MTSPLALGRAAKPRATDGPEFSQMVAGGQDLVGKQRQGEMPRARREQQSVTQVSLSSKLARYLGKEHGRELDSELSGVSWKWSPSQESLREDPMQVIKAASVV